MLAEALTKDISQAVNPEGFENNETVAQQGGNVAKVALDELEARTGKKVVTAANAKTMLNEKVIRNLESGDPEN
jgi:glutamate dehydrogenase/leucine dehydrogenase